MNIREELFKLKDEEYKCFSSKLTRTKYPMIGIRIPLINGINTKNPEKQMGIGFGSKVSYDFYSVAQAYFPEDYSNYGIFSVTPFISFMLKN